MNTWRCYTPKGFAGYQNALPNLTEQEVLDKFNARTGLGADHAEKVES